MEVPWQPVFLFCLDAPLPNSPPPQRHEPANTNNGHALNLVDATLAPREGTPPNCRASQRRIGKLDVKNCVVCYEARLYFVANCQK